MKISWGTKIAILYIGFMGLIITLVVASTRQHFDLVSANYYTDEIAYQKVIDAGKNQASMSVPVKIETTDGALKLQLPPEFQGKAVTGSVQFYSAVDAAWDKKFDLKLSNNTMNIERKDLKNTHYTVKITLNADGKQYYQETEIGLKA